MGAVDHVHDRVISNRYDRMQPAAAYQRNTVLIFRGYALPKSVMDRCTSPTAWQLA